VTDREHYLLAATANDRWVAQVSVALLSASLRTPGHPPCLIVDCGLTAKSRDTLRTMFDAYDVRLDWLSPDLEALHALPVDAPHLGPETYARLDIPLHLRDRAARTVYIDADTLSLGSIAELASIDLRGATIGAVQDPRVRFISDRDGVTGWRRLGLSPANAYFNAGVLVIDNDRWVEDGCREAVLDLVREHPEEVVFADQGPLNAVLADRWQPVPERWNMVLGPAVSVRQSAQLGARFRRWPGSSAPSEGTIFHFAGPVKPWHPNYAPTTQRWLYSRAWSRYAPFAPPLRHLAAWRWIGDMKLYERDVTLDDPNSEVAVRRGRRFERREDLGGDLLRGVRPGERS
jgi:lipopolysaccharide biosynthesis glycosyltransferase